MSDEKISTKILCAIFATGILSFCGVAGETAMNITFPVLMKHSQSIRQPYSGLQPFIY